MDLRTLTAGIALAGMTTIAQAGGGASSALVTIDHVEALPGSTAQVGVTIEVDDLIGSLDFNADAQGLQFVDIAYDGWLFANGWEGWDTTPSMTPNVSAACIFPEDQVTGFQALFTMQIDVPEDAVTGDTLDVDFTTAFVTNYQFTPFDVTVVAGSITVVGSNVCDADLVGNDGIVGVPDMLALLNAWGEVKSPADLNGDGIVSGGDLLVLLGAWGACP